MKVINFGPGGFTLPYTLGVCTYLKESYDLRDYRFVGSSAGSWLSVYTASDMSCDDVCDYILPEVYDRFKSYNLFQRWKCVGKYLIDTFPVYIDDMRFIDSKEISVSLSQYRGGLIRNVVVDDYNNLDELLHLCYMSSYIPLLSGYGLPVHKSHITFDGGLSDVDIDYSFSLDYSMFGRVFGRDVLLGNDLRDLDSMVSMGYMDAFNNRSWFDSKIL